MFFSCFLKETTGSALWGETGGVFHSLGATPSKAVAPVDSKLVCRIDNKFSISDVGGGELRSMDAVTQIDIRDPDRAKRKDFKLDPILFAGDQGLTF